MIMPEPGKYGRAEVFEPHRVACRVLAVVLHLARNAVLRRVARLAARMAMIRRRTDFEALGVDGASVRRGHPRERAGQREAYRAYSGCEARRANPAGRDGERHRGQRLAGYDHGCRDACDTESRLLSLHGESGAADLGQYASEHVAIGHRMRGEAAQRTRQHGLDDVGRGVRKQRLTDAGAGQWQPPTDSRGHVDTAMAADLLGVDDVEPVADA